MIFRAGAVPSNAAKIVSHLLFELTPTLVLQYIYQVREQASDVEGAEIVVGSATRL
jgi:hypothetical protein